jgi:hypothetical protein
MLRSPLSSPLSRPLQSPLAARRGGGAAFDPAFIPDTAVYDVQVFSSMFQDLAETVPVTAVGQSVRVIKDRSSLGYDLVAPSDAARPVLGVDGAGLFYLDLPTGTQTMQSSIVVERATPQLIAGLIAYPSGSSSITDGHLRIAKSSTEAFELCCRAGIRAIRSRVRYDAKSITNTEIAGASANYDYGVADVHHVIATSGQMIRGIGDADNYNAATPWTNQTFDSAVINIKGANNSPIRFYAGVFCLHTSASTRKQEIIDWLKKN